MQTASSRQGLRFAAIEVMDEDDRLTRDDCLVRTEVRQLDLKSSLGKSSVLLVKRNTAGKSNGQKVSLGFKPKVQFRPKQDKAIVGPSSHEGGPIIIQEGNSGPDHALDQAGQSNAFQNKMKEGVKLVNELGHEFSKSEIPIGLDCNKQLAHTPDGNHNGSNAMVLHMSSKKSVDKKSKNKNQRTHVIVQGNISTVAQQGSSSNKSNNKHNKEPSHDATIMEQNDHSDEQWDPNEDIAPDFLEDNGMIVPETQLHQIDDGGSEQAR